MGGGNFSTEYYAQRQAMRNATGQDAFDYDRRMQTAEMNERHCHSALDPKQKPQRESRDSPEHPESLAITLFFDETGSMDTVPRILQTHLDTFMSDLIRNGVHDPQIMAGAIGDGGMGEIAPIQVGEWESDNRIDDHLCNIYLERGGGGNRHESYELALYFMARHTATDCWEKRQHKGYLFIIGDELPYEEVDRHTVERYIGVDIGKAIKLETIAQEVTERFETFFLIPTGLGAYEPEHYARVRRRWSQLLGSEHVLNLEDPAQASKCIAKQIGMLEKARRLQTSAEAETEKAPAKRRSRITRL